MVYALMLLGNKFLVLQDASRCFKCPPAALFFFQFIDTEKLLKAISHIQGKNENAILPQYLGGF